VRNTVSLGERKQFQKRNNYDRLRTPENILPEATNKALSSGRQSDSSNQKAQFYR
jgi:hypothetical protein